MLELGWLLEAGVEGSRHERNECGVDRLTHTRAEQVSASPGERRRMRRMMMEEKVTAGGGGVDHR